MSNHPKKAIVGRSSGDLSAKKSEVKRRNPNPRNPLKDLDGAAATAAAAGSSASATPATKRGRSSSCFKFLLTTPSSKPTTAGFLPRSKSLSRTRSAPPAITATPSKARSLPSKLPGGSTKDPTTRSTDLGSRRRVLGSTNAKKPSTPSDRRPPINCTGRPITVSGDKRSSKLGSEDWKTEEGSCAAASTPDWKEGEQRLQQQQQKLLVNTPSSSNTPPIQASISPEITAGSPATSAAATCFGTGHLMAGVRDRRKCRPRGILTVGGNASETPKLLQGAARASLVSPPLADASIRWLCLTNALTVDQDSGFSPPKIASLNHWNADEALLSPGEIIFIENETPPPHLGSGDQSASSLSESSTSPFSTIIRRAEASEAALSSRRKAAEEEKMSFQFPRRQGSPSSSIDLTHFQKHHPTDEESLLSISGMRISWREGLAGHIFDMGETDFCQWLADSRVESQKIEEKPDFSEAAEAPREDDAGVQKSKPEVAEEDGRSSIPCSESISLEEEEERGLFSSGDSDWTLFYKNRLFEI